MKNKIFFSLSHNNVDIYYIELDSLKNENDFIDKLNQVKASINNIVDREYMILHLEESKITNNILKEILSFISDNKDKMKRLGIVGVHGLLYLKLKKHMMDITLLDYYFCNDFQKAKDIVIGKIGK